MPNVTKNVKKYDIKKKSSNPQNTSPHHQEDGEVGRCSPGAINFGRGGEGGCDVPENYTPGGLAPDLPSLTEVRGGESRPLGIKS